MTELFAHFLVHQIDGFQVVLDASFPLLGLSGSNRGSRKVRSPFDHFPYVQISRGSHFFQGRLCCGVEWRYFFPFGS